MYGMWQELLAVAVVAEWRADRERRARHERMVRLAHEAERRKGQSQ
ncbi:MAG: hypothetical protein ACK2T6_03465 [Anaerolineae bacterium]|jgi:hypothetical protein